MNNNEQATLAQIRQYLSAMGRDTSSLSDQELNESLMGALHTIGSAHRGISGIISAGESDASGVSGCFSTPQFGFSTEPSGIVPGAVLSEEVLRATAEQWQMWENFAWYLSGRFCLSIDPVRDAQTYALYFYRFTPEQWEQVTAYRQEQGGIIAVPSVPPWGRDPGFSISLVAMQARALFGFGARITVHAWQTVSIFLRDYHGYSVHDWARVEALVETIEANIRR